MKQTILILWVILACFPGVLHAQETTSLNHGWGLGFQLGVGGLLPTSSLGDDFKGCALFTGGLNIEYNRARLKLDFSYGQPSFKNGNPYAVVDSQGRDQQLNATANPTLLGFSFQLGYTVWRQGRLSVTPCVGMTASRLSWDINHIKYEADDQGQERPSIDDVTGTRENNFDWTASVDFDIKLHGKLVENSLGGEHQVHYTSSVRISPFVTHAKFKHFNPSIKGCCVGITLSYVGMFSRLL